MTTSIIRSIAQQVRPKPNTRSMFDGLLSPATTSRSAGANRISDKRVWIEATLIMQGFEASMIKTLLPLVQQHLSHVQARKAVFQNLTFAESDHFRVACDAKVTLLGYDDPEAEIIRPSVEQFTIVPDDNENLKASWRIMRDHSLQGFPEKNPWSIPQLIRRLSATATRMGLSPAMTRSTGATESEFEQELEKRHYNTQVKVVANLILEGFEASKIIALLPFVQPHLDHLEARNVVYKNLAEGLDKHVCVGCHAKVTLDNYELPDAIALQSVCTTLYDPSG